MNKIFKSYTDISNPGSFSGLSGFLKNNKFNKSQSEKVLQGTETFTLHQPIKHKFARNRVIVGGIDDTWQADLVDVHQLKYQNKHYKYILTCIDVFSKYAWAVPIKTKTAQSTREGFEIILKSGRIPKNLYIDGGNEFKGECKKLLDKNNVKIYLTKSKLKASIVERFNRTLKEKMWRVFTFNKNKKYFDILPDLLTSYNNSFHRSIKTTPSKVNLKNQDKVFISLYGYDKHSGSEDYVKLKFKIGTYVRIALDKALFEKGYTPNWSKDIYIIKNILLKSEPLYKLVTIEGEPLEISYYDKQLTKVQYDEFPYDTYKIHDENKNSILIEQLNSQEPKQIWENKLEFLE